MVEITKTTLTFVRGDKMRSPLRAACKRLSYPVAVARVSPTLDPYSTLDVAETKVAEHRQPASAHSGVLFF